MNPDIYDDMSDYRWRQDRLKSQAKRIDAWFAHYVAKGCPAYKARVRAQRKGLYKQSWPKAN